MGSGEFQIPLSKSHNFLKGLTVLALANYELSRSAELILPTLPGFSPHLIPDAPHRMEPLPDQYKIERDTNPEEHLIIAKAYDEACYEFEKLIRSPNSH